MIKSKGKCIPSFLVFLLLFIINGVIKAQEQVHLFPDCSFAVSGDTVWFNVFILNGDSDNVSNVVHVQLDDTGNRHISKVSVTCTGNRGEGYIQIPDSLSTGVYVIKAFLLVQKNTGAANINQRLITVYNRFDDELYTIQTPETDHLLFFSSNENISIETDKEKYQRGEQVTVKIRIPREIADESSNVIITAGLSDPFSEQFISSCVPVLQKAKTKFPVSFAEKNGVLLTGQVTLPDSSAPVSNAVVLLSIPDSVPYFDYCITDSVGEFYFYLRNATGTADLVLQAISKETDECRIELFENYIDNNGFQCQEKILAVNERTFVDGIIKASYFTKLFKGYNIKTTNRFSMPPAFRHPFYGEPSKSFYPELFFDLPDFKEISREILHGVQYRERKEQTTIRLIDNGGKSVFKEEPLKLLDGIPVFDTHIFTPLGTKEIKRVDAVFYTRYFGDLTFKGVLAVYTKNQSLGWVDSMPGMGHFSYSCLQPAAKWNFSNKSVPNTNVPNFSKVLFRESRNGNKINSASGFGFCTSDITGDVAIRVIVVENDNHIYFSNKIIKVE